MIFQRTQPTRLSRFAAFGYYAIDPNSLTLPSIPDIMGGIDIFSDDVYKMQGQVDPNAQHNYRENGGDSFYSLWGQLQTTINGAKSSVDMNDPLSVPLVLSIKNYLTKLSSAIEASKSALKSMGDDQSKTLRARNLVTCFNIMREANAALPALVSQVQGAIADRAARQAAAAQAAAAAKAAADAAAAQKAAEAQQTALIQQQTASAQAATAKAAATVQLDQQVLQQTQAQTALAKGTATTLFGLPVPVVLLGGAALLGGGVYFSRRKSKTKSA